MLLAVALGAVLGELGRHGALLVHQCVPGGPVGWFGLQLALLRPDATCASGLAVGGEQRQMIGVVVIVTVPVLLANLAVAALGVGLGTRLRRLVRAVAVVMASLARRLPAPGAPVRVTGRTQVDARPSAAAGRGLAVVPWRRGPPSLQLA